MTGRRGPVIRTPDQRIRVFVSSTLRELAAERRAVRAAIEGLRLAPVMFELGARPHPPRELYRAYLAAERRVRRHLRRQLRLGRAGRGRLGARGRVQPRPGGDAEAHLPQGVRRPRARLTELIDRIKADDTVSYVLVSTPRAAGRARRRGPGDAAGRALRRARAGARRHPSARAPAGACPPRTPRRSAGRPMSPPCSSWSRGRRCAW